MEKVNLSRSQEIAVFESMQNLAAYVATLQINKTDTTLYFHFQEIINAVLGVEIDNRFTFFEDGDLPDDLRLKYLVEDHKLKEVPCE